VVDTSGAKYQLWAIPVSLRARKAAARRQARNAAADSSGRTSSVASGSTRSQPDQVMDDLRELAEARAATEGAQGEVSVRWAYEIMGPALAGAVVLVILLAVG
jgi:Flp pilus assembly protein TadB